MLITSHSHPRRRSEFSKSDWNKLVKPKEGQGDLVTLDRVPDGDHFETIGEARARVGQLDFHPIDPFVASIASSVAGGRVELPKGESVLELQIPEFYRDGVEVQMFTPHGEQAPMMVILPGIHGTGDGSLTLQLKKIALEKGMNYVVIPNALGHEMMEDEPLYHPGNPRVEAQAAQKVLEKLKADHPNHFETISMAGYSYGGLLGANMLRLQEEQGTNLINGSFVAISPPENLAHSMQELDGLRQVYAEDGGSIAWTGLKYRRHVAKYGYERFMESSLSQRDQTSNITEVKIADKYGSRDEHETTTNTVDEHFEHDLLPKHTEEYQEAGFFKRRRMRGEHERLLDETNYAHYSADYFSKDKWLVERGLTTDELAEQYSFTRAMEVIQKAPVMLLGSADDYILNDSDVEALRKLEKNPGDLEVVRVFDHGGHVGLLWNPEVQDTVGDFVIQRPASV